VLTRYEQETLRIETEYCRNHPKVKRLLKSGRCEVSGFAPGIRARFDHLRTVKGTTIVTDLKTCRDASSEACGREIVQRGYHVQAAWYRSVLRALGRKSVEWYFIFLQKGREPLVNVFNLCPLAMDVADKQIADALLMLDRCEASNIWPEWPDYDGTDDIKQIDLPAYAYPEDELTGAEQV
jgi:hypothetical protein